MKLARLDNRPAALIDFFQDGLEALGAVCDRSWHDKLQLVAEGAAARLWNPDGALMEAEVHFVPPDATGPRQADREVFAGCPLTFRLAEELRAKPVPLERAILQPLETPRPPTIEVAEKLWHAQIPGTSRWRFESTLLTGWHFSLLALARCEVQAIDQRWTLHRVALSLPGGQPDESLATSLDFLQLSPSAPSVPWPPVDLTRWHALLKQNFQQDLEPDLTQIRERQQKYLRRELDRIETYFQNYEKELTERHQRSHAEGTRIKAEQRLAAAKSEHARRREDQVHRHEIRVIAHLDALVLLAEPAWQTKVSFLQKAESRTAPAVFIPRSRRWIM